MSSQDKLNRLERESTNTAVHGACAMAKSRCSICQEPIDHQGSKSNKCGQCIRKMNAIPTGFHFEVDGAEKKEFECPICLGIIRDSTELPCHHLMCLACLTHYENEEIQKVKTQGLDEGKATFLCSICQRPYKPKDVSTFQ